MLKNATIGVEGKDEVGNDPTKSRSKKQVFCNLPCGHP
jgi:hypothetical protein